MTSAAAKLEDLYEGLTIRGSGTRPFPMPLDSTEIAVDIAGGLAIVTTVRRFINRESNPIEAVLTMPVGFDAIVTGLSAVVDGRRLIATAKPKAEARDWYEGALDRGNLTVLHEELLRGLHMLSVGNLAPDAKVAVTLETVVPLTVLRGLALLRLPMTAGEIYGTSPLMPSDAILTDPRVRHRATLTVTGEGVQPILAGSALPLQVAREIELDRALEILVQGQPFGRRSGIAADRRVVTLDLAPAAPGEGRLDLAILVDHSGSTGSPIGSHGLSVWQAIKAALEQVLDELRVDDRIHVWEFDHQARFVATRTGPSGDVAQSLHGPRGGTELGKAVAQAIRAGARDILVLTDGQTWAHEVDALMGREVRIGAVLVGRGSLDVTIGHLCAQTGGSLFYAHDDDVASALRPALALHRQPLGASQGQVTHGQPMEVSAVRGGVLLTARWEDPPQAALHGTCDAVGRFAAALALPVLAPHQATAWAEAHALCTHATSLVLVDEEGARVADPAEHRKVPMMEPVAARMFQIAPPEAQAFTVVDYCLDARPVHARHRRDARPPSRMAMLRDVTDELKQHAEQVGQVIDWATHWTALVQGDLSGLPEELREAILELAELARQDLSQLTSDHAAVMVVLRWAAAGLCDRNRHAERFLRRTAPTQADGGPAT